MRDGRRAGFQPVRALPPENLIVLNWSFPPDPSRVARDNLFLGSSLPLPAMPAEVVVIVVTEQPVFLETGLKPVRTHPGLAPRQILFQP